MTTAELRPYRFTPRPGRRELFDSYSSRVLAANFEDASHQRWLVKALLEDEPDTSTEGAWPRILAAKTRRDLGALDAARFGSPSHPDGSTCAFCLLGFQNRYQCALCSAGEVVQQQAHPHDNVCVRHRRWTGPAADPTKQHAVGKAVVDAELAYRKLVRRHRLDAPLYQRIRRALSGIDQPEGNPRLDSTLYPEVVAIAAALTTPRFRRGFFDPNQTFASAYEQLRSTLRDTLCRDDNALARSLWLYFRPTFLDLREALDEGRPYKSTGPHTYALPGATGDAYGKPMRPLEPFRRYLEVTGDDTLATVNLNDVVNHYAHARTVNGQDGNKICLRGHRTAGAATIGRTLNYSVTEKCPICEHREILSGFNDLQTTHPHLAAQLDPAKNDGVTARDLFAGSPRSYVWTCRAASVDHDFEATAANRTSNGSGCPLCLNRLIVPGINDLDTLQPSIAAEFDRDGNNGIDLEALAPGSNRVVTWRCELGHTYRMSVGDRTRGGGCRFCPDGDRKLRALAICRPDLAAQYNQTLNSPRTPDDITIGSHVSLFWNCSRGHVYEQTAERRNAGYGCPFCSGQRFQLGVTDALSLHPDLCREWHPYKNGTLQPQDRDARTRSIWWKCLAEAHVTQQTLALRIKSGGCTHCQPARRVRPAKD